MTLSHPLQPRPLLQKFVHPFAASRGHADAQPQARSLGRLGTLEVRLALSPAEIRAAQALRYRVFFKEMSAESSWRQRLTRRDTDAFDAACDHLLVLDHAQAENGRPAIVGTYRLLRQDRAPQGRFYSDDEFDIATLMARQSGLNFLELGRSCVLKPYRDKRTVELLWQGIWAYVLEHGCDALLGCASLEGTEPERLALPLSYLHHFHRAPEDWRASARCERLVAMDMLPREAIDPRAALRTLPPLVKGYLRLGCYIGDGAVVDHKFGTTDVLIVLPRSAINPRYVHYYGESADRHAA